MYTKQLDAETEEKKGVELKELFAAVYSSLAQLDAETQHNLLNEWRSRLLEEKAKEHDRLRTLADKLEKEMAILKN